MKRSIVWLLVLILLTASLPQALCAESAVTTYLKNDTLFLTVRGSGGDPVTLKIEKGGQDFYLDSLYLPVEGTHTWQISSAAGELSVTVTVCDQRYQEHFSKDVPTESVPSEPATAPAVPSEAPNVPTESEALPSSQPVTQPETTPASQPESQPGADSGSGFHTVWVIIATLLAVGAGGFAICYFLRRKTDT